MAEQKIYGTIEPLSVEKTAVIYFSECRECVFRDKGQNYGSAVSHREKTGHAILIEVHGTIELPGTSDAASRGSGS